MIIFLIISGFSIIYGLMFWGLCYPSPINHQLMDMEIDNSLSAEARRSRSISVSESFSDIFKRYQ